MSVHVNIAKAKATLSELVARAEAGEEVVLTRNGKAAVTLTPTAKPQAGPRRLGAWAHLAPLMDPDMFLGPDSETDAAMEEHRIFPDEG